MARTKKAFNTERLEAVQRVSARMKGFRPAKEVLTKVRAHPTIFPLYDRATKVGGHPIERICLVHGPSTHGKTAFVHGLGLSFLRAGNFYAYIDAEYTTPEDWLNTLMGSYSEHPGFLANRPKSYEETVDAVRDFANKIHDAREKRELEPDSTALIVVDSVRKLVPEGLLAKLLKGAKEGGMDGASGRGAMIKAALNSQWLDELVPLLYHTKTAMVFITREIDAELDLAKLHEPGHGAKVKTTGGRAMLYDSSLVMRVTRGWVKEGPKDAARIVGERHSIEITKTKVSGHKDKSEYGYFHTSNGEITPVGFDRARDVLELATDAGVVEKAGSWISWERGGKKWHGDAKAIVELSQDQGLLDTLEGEARS